MTDSSQHDLTALSYAVGFIVINWALIEQSMDHCVRAIYRGCNGKCIRPRLPVSCKPKIEFLEASLKTLLQLEEFKEDGLMLLRDIADIADMRNNLVHGVIESIHSDSGVYTFNRLKTHPDSHSVLVFKFNLQTAPKFVARSQEVQTKIGMLATSLNERFG
jgi:hypothetical protein